MLTIEEQAAWLQRPSHNAKRPVDQWAAMPCCVRVTVLTRSRIAVTLPASFSEILNTQRLRLGTVGFLYRHHSYIEAMARRPLARAELVTLVTPSRNKKPAPARLDFTPIEKPNCFVKEVRPIDRISCPESACVTSLIRR